MTDSVLARGVHGVVGHRCRDASKASGVGRYSVLGLGTVQTRSAKFWCVEEGVWVSGCGGVAAWKAAIGTVAT